MRLEKVKIKNIKSIKDSGVIYFNGKNPITILAGQNESGKTSFLKALKYFEEGSYDLFEEDDMRMDEIPRVECTFMLSAQELDNLMSVTNKELSDYIKSNGFTLVRSLWDEEHSLRYLNPKDFEVLVNEHNEKVKTEESVSSEDVGKASLTTFYPLSYFGNLRPKVIFYSSFLENNLPHVADTDDIKTNQAVLDFQEVYDISFSDLMVPEITDQKRRAEEKRVNKVAGDSLNKYWNQKIQNEVAEYKYAKSRPQHINCKLFY